MTNYNKRLIKEFSELKKKFPCELELSIEKKNILRIGLDNFIVNINADEFYPFKAPKVFIQSYNNKNNTSSLNFFLNSYSRFQILYNKYGQHLKDCPCCYTVLYNWGPGNKIEQIIEEIIKWETDRERIKKIILFNKINILPFDNYIIDYIKLYI